MVPEDIKWIKKIPQIRYQDRYEIPPPVQRHDFIPPFTIVATNCRLFQCESSGHKTPQKKNKNVLDRPGKCDILYAGKVTRVKQICTGLWNGVRQHKSWENHRSFVVAVTQQDIATRVGVKRSLVSVVLNHKPLPIKIAEDTRKRIFQVAQEMNYKPNLLAQGLAKGKTHSIGFLTASIGLEVVSTFVATLDGIAEEAGYDVYTVHTKTDLKSTIERADKLISRGFDGIIIRGMFPGIDADELQAGFNFSIPTVFLNAYMPFPCRQVCQDGAIGVKQGVEYLYGLGHRRIYMLRSDWNGWENDTRFVGFRQAIDSYGLGGEELIYKVSGPSHSSMDGSRILDTHEIFHCVKEFLELHPDCTAIMCSGDHVATMILSALFHLGVKVPEDISVVGFEGLPLSLYCRPTLSTVVRPVNKLTHTALDLLLESIEKGTDDPKKLVIPTEFVPRESTGPVRTPRRA